MLFAPYDWANGSSVDVFCMKIIVLVLWKLVVI